jgi:thioredoxin-like negative regulator of GroEL
MNLLAVLKELPLSLLVVSLAFAAAIPAQSVDLTPDNFQQTIEHGSWFVKFFSPWCTHCKKLAPKWQVMEGKVAEEVPSVKIAQVDCAMHGGLFLIRLSSGILLTL